jgi:MFS family permease
VGLAIFDQLVGINTVIYYAPTIFGYAGFTSASSAILATGVVGIVNVLATIVASTLIDKIGRRPLLQWGSIGMAITLGALGTIFAFGPQQTGYLTLAVLLIYIVSFALSMGPVVRLMNAEIYPTRLRAMGSSIASFANWNANLLVSFTFLSLIHLLGKPLTFWLYAFLGILAFIFSTILVPETKGKSLEQIEHYWRNGRSWEAMSSPQVAHASLSTEEFSERS